jgi:hypothetical protein
MDNMTIATSTSISENPLDILDGVNVLSPQNGFELVCAKHVPMNSDDRGEKTGGIKLYNGFNGLGAEANKLRAGHRPFRFLLLMKSLN